MDKVRISQYLKYENKTSILDLFPRIVKVKPIILDFWGQCLPQGWWYCKADAGVVCQFWIFCYIGRLFCHSESQAQVLGGIDTAQHSLSDHTYHSPQSNGVGPIESTSYGNIAGPQF